MKVHIANTIATTALHYFPPVTPIYFLFSKAKRKYSLSVLPLDYRETVHCTIF